MKKLTVILMAAVLMMNLMLPGAALADEKKINVVTTIFPIYDWVREVAGQEADRLELTMLLDSGADLHNYQPTAPDILKIATCDLFIFVGGESDEWTEDVLRHSMNPNMLVINLLDALGDAVKEEEAVEGMEHEHHHDEDEDHDHEDEHDHDHEEEEHEADEHIWLSLRNARLAAQVIADALSRIDPDHADAFKANDAAFAAKLEDLDARYAAAVEAGARKTILFGDRFPFRYLADDYGLAYYAAFSGCSAESEASFETIAFLAGKVDEMNLPAVLTIENPKTRIAETIVQTTKNKDQKILHMDSMQSVTAQALKDGAHYLDIMESNLKVLEEALR